MTDFLVKTASYTEYGAVLILFHLFSKNDYHFYFYCDIINKIHLLYRDGFQMPTDKKYTVDFSSWEGFFCVPHEVADRHLKLASPNAIKVLLYILRQGKVSFDISSVSSALSLNENEVSDAVIYWCGAGIFSSADSTEKLLGINEATSVSKAIPQEKSRKANRIVRPDYSAEDVAESLEKREDLKYLLSRAEEIFARPLSNSAIMTLFTLCDWEGISADIICMVMERCLKENKLSMSHIASEARRWNEDGIKTLSQADEYIIELDMRKSMYGQVRSAFGIGPRNFSKKERDFIDSWRKDFGFGIDMITLAFDACVNAKGVMSFSYINSILRNWNDKDIRTPSDVEAADKKFKASSKKLSKKNVSYDLEDEAKKALSRFGQSVD